MKRLCDDIWNLILFYSDIDDWDNVDQYRPIKKKGKTIMDKLSQTKRENLPGTKLYPYSVETLELRMSVVKVFPDALMYIGYDMKTPELCMVVVKRSRNALYFYYCSYCS